MPEYGNILSAMYGEKSSVTKVLEWAMTLAEYAEDIYRTGPMYLNAKDVGALLKNQIHLAKKAEILMRSFAKVRLEPLSP